MEGSPESELVLDYGKICCQYFVAPMGSGKTEAIKSLIHSAAKTGIYKWFLVMSPTRLSGEWDCLPDEAVVSFSPEKMISIYRQIRKYREKCHKEGKKAIKKRGCVILDDCIGSAQKLWHYAGKKGGDPEDNFLNCFIQTRHSAIDIWISSQTYCGAVPSVRNLMNYVWIWNSTNPSVTKPLHAFVGGRCDSHRHFVKVLNEATQHDDYAVLVVKPQAKTFEGTYTSFVPEMVKPFKLKFKLPFKVS